MIPPARFANTRVDVQQMFSTGYFRSPATPFWDGRDITEVQVGTLCLWKAVPTGKVRRGGEIAKMELFHGECQGWQDEFVILSCDVGGAPLLVHPSYLVGDPNKEYCIAAGGRCYREADVWATLLQKVQCPQCGYQLKDQWAYESHYQSAHL